jgi:UMF1 family MFS transporter
MVTWPQWFGLADASAAVKVSFITVAVWWALFSVPIFLFVNEEPRSSSLQVSALSAAYTNVVLTLKQVMRLKTTFLFLVAYWFYIDGVDTIIRMAVDFGLSVGLDSNGLLAALLLTQFVGFPAALAFGKLGERKGPKFGISVCLGVYVLIVLWAWQLSEQWEFYLLALAVGLVQGGIQSLSRSLYSRLVPVQQKAEFFGFYNMLGKFAAVIGPLLVGSIALLTNDPRSGILSVLILFAIGGFLLAKVDVLQGTEDAASFILKTPMSGK